MIDVLITEFMDQAAVRGLSESMVVVYEPDLVDRPGDLAKLSSQARALVVRNRTRVTGELLRNSPRVECIGRLGVGLDNIDLDACERRGIPVYPATGANDDSVAEYVLSVAMHLLRPFQCGTAEVASGAWPRESSIGREIGGKTLGLVGFGSIARNLARRARAFGMTCIACDPLVKPDDPAWELAARADLGTVLAKADVVSLHVPLTPDTYHMIGETALASMRPDAVLINAARGGVVDDAALAQCLREGGLAGAALDVFETEPLTEAHGRLFQGLGNIVLTPHIAGVTHDSNERVSRLIANRVRSALSGAR